MAMRRIFRRFSSARARLILWNTLTFALVLVSLGIVFRVLAERSLLTALDREMHLQASRFRDAQRIEMVVMSDGAPKHRMDFHVYPGEPKAIQINRAEVRTHYRVIQNLSLPTPDKSGQFLYRSFDLNGRPLSPLKVHLPFVLPFPGQDMLNDDKSEQKDRLADYRPWDMAAFKEAARGRERYLDVDSGGTHMRVLSVPFKHDEKIAGVVQIAAPLGQVTRDIAGLTRSLLLVLPLSLLVAVVAGIFLTERALRPVKEMTRAAAEIRPDQLSRRLPVSAADEFGELAATFNGALGRVEKAFIDRERAIAQLRRFTADASHELRTPLTTIKTNTGVALTEPEPSSEHIHALRQIDRAADRMTALVQDLLLLARSDAGQLALDLAPVSLAEIIQEAIDCLPVPHAPIALDARGPGALICGDREHLLRLFLNLLQNSVRHTPADGTIAVIIEQSDGAAIVTMHDTGCGIAPEHLPHIGQPFFRADAGRNRKQGGAGLGVAICRSIAAAHGASLEIDSELHHGTTVTVTFAPQV